MRGARIEQTIDSTSYALFAGFARDTKSLPSAFLIQHYIQPETAKTGATLQTAKLDHPSPCTGPQLLSKPVATCFALTAVKGLWSVFFQHPVTTIKIDTRTARAKRGFERAQEGAAGKTL